MNEPAVSGMQSSRGVSQAGAAGDALAKGLDALSRGVEEGRSMAVDLATDAP